MCRLGAILIIGFIAAYSMVVALGKPEYLVRGFIIATVALGVAVIRTSAKGVTLDKKP